jgi:hypothetical protein
MAHMLAQTEDEILVLKAGYSHSLQGGKRLKRDVDNNDKIYIHSF